MKTLAILSTVAVSLALPVAAQQVIPASSATVEGNSSSLLPFGYSSFHSQHLIEASSIAKVAASISGIALRGNFNTAGYSSAVFPNVTVSVGYSNNAANGMTTSFAGNASSPMAVVYQGALTLNPVAAPMGSGPLAWSISIPFTKAFVYNPALGNLLVDLVSDNGASTRTGWSVDTLQAGGSHHVYGTGGTLSGHDRLGLVVNTGISSHTPGGKIEIAATTSFNSYVGEMLVGFRGLPVGIDLTPLGAVGNSLYIDAVASVPLSFQSSFIGKFALVAVPLPSTPSLVGASLFSQAYVLDAAANAAGLVTTQAASVTIGDPAIALPIQQLSSKDPKAATGTLELISRGGGGAPLVLSGTFQ